MNIPTCCGAIGMAMAITACAVDLEEASESAKGEPAVTVTGAVSNSVHDCMRRSSVELNLEADASNQPSPEELTEKLLADCQEQIWKPTPEF